MPYINIMTEPTAAIEEHIDKRRSNGEKSVDDISNWYWIHPIIYYILLISHRIKKTNYQQVNFHSNPVLNWQFKNHFAILLRKYYLF